MRRPLVKNCGLHFFMRRLLVKKCGPLVKNSHVGINAKNIDIFGATKK